MIALLLLALLGLLPCHIASRMPSSELPHFLGTDCVPGGAWPQIFPQAQPMRTLTPALSPGGAKPLAQEFSVPLTPKFLPRPLLSCWWSH